MDARFVVWIQTNIYTYAISFFQAEAAEEYAHLRREFTELPPLPPWNTLPEPYARERKQKRWRQKPVTIAKQTFVASIGVDER